MILALALAWAVILAGGWLGWQLLRQNGRILLRLDELEKRPNEVEFGGEDEREGLPLGSDAPEFELPGLAGERKSLTQFRGQPLLLLFFNPACGFCRDLLPKLAGLSLRSSRREEAQTEIPPPKSEIDQSLVTSAAASGENTGRNSFVLIISSGDAGTNRQLFNEHQLSCPVLLQKEAEVAATYKANGTPSGYLISAEGGIASELAIGAEAVLKLLERKVETGRTNAEMDDGLLSSNGAAREERRVDRFKNRSLARSKIKRDGLKAGTPAPDFRLPRLDGRGELALSDLRGRRVLLAFSSPSCGPCNALAPELEKFHRQHPELEVVMMSKGEPKENRAKLKGHGLTFTVVLQQQWEISRRYGMFATPIAYLLDEQGVIAADVAVGVEPILALLIDANSRAREREQALR